jgi:hypothetical protein
VTGSMEEIRKTEGLNLEELEAQSVELLPDREEMNLFSNNTAIAVAVNGSAAAANAGNVFIFAVR